MKYLYETAYRNLNVICLFHANVPFLLWKIVTSLTFFQFTAIFQFGAIQNPDSRRIVCKTYISINIKLLSYKNWKQN